MPRWRKPQGDRQARGICLEDADKTFAQGETRGSLTDRGMVSVLLGPPTYVGRKPIAPGEGKAESSGLSTVSRNHVTVALRNISGRSTTGQQTTVIGQMTGPGTKAIDAANNWREIRHYRKLLLPGIPYLQVDFDFITRKGYGQNVLQRGSTALTTLEAARKSAVRTSTSPEK